jgi:hypothetical protein
LGASTHSHRTCGDAQAFLFWHRLNQTSATPCLDSVYKPRLSRVCLRGKGANPMEIFVPSDGLYWASGNAKWISGSCDPCAQKCKCCGSSEPKHFANNETYVSRTIHARNARKFRQNFLSPLQMHPHAESGLPFRG